MKPWTFVHVADMQVGSPRSFRFAPAWNENWGTARRQIAAIGPDLLLVGGDLTRDGSLHRYELENMKADLDRLPFPCHVVPGNMDTGNKRAAAQGPRDKRDDVSLNIASEQVANFESVFGPTHWSLVHKGVRFSGLCDMLINSGLPEEGAQWEWMDAQRKLPRERQHVWIMHGALFIDRLEEPNFDIRAPDEYVSWYFGMDEPGRGRLFEAFEATGATHVITGHIHCRKMHFAGGIRFDLAPATCMSQFADHWEDGDPTLGFLRYDVGSDGIACTFVALEQVSTKKGYGPGGHPLPEARDYSIAWEK